MYEVYGDADVLKLDEAVAMSAVVEDQVLVIVAAALNPVDAKRRAGKFRLSRSPRNTA